MDRFLRPKRKADAIPLSEELATASQPSESRPDIRPCESEAGNSTADHAPSGNVPKLAKRSAMFTVNSNIEVVSCSSDTEVDEFEIPDQDQTARYEETLEKIKLRDPEAVQWLRDDTHIDDGAASCDPSPKPSTADYHVFIVPEHNEDSKDRQGESARSGKIHDEAYSPREQHGS